MAQIRKTIKINVDSDIANTKLRQIKQSTNQIPKQLNMDVKNFVEQIGLATIAVGGLVKAFGSLKNAFFSLAEDQHMIKRIQNAIRATSTQFQFSAQAIAD